MSTMIATIRPYFQGRTRFLLAWIFATLLLVTTKSYPTAPGIAICFLGASLRFWASGHLRKEASLAIGGPYQFTRNPLYLGTLLMMIGAFVSVNSLLLGLIAAVVFTINYAFVIEHEEEKLPRYFGEAYLKYKALVPRFFPRILPPSRAELEAINPDPRNYSFDFKLAWFNKAYEAYASFLGLIAALFLIVWIRQKII